VKICYLANAGSIHTQRWARHFSNRGHQVTVVSFQPGSIDNIPVIQILRRTVWRRFDIILGISRVRQIVREINPDILHAQYVTSYGFAGALTWKHPYVATAWGTDVLIEPERSWMYRQIVRFALRRADLITSMAPHMTELLIRRGYANPEKIITLPFGVDTDLFNPAKRTRFHGKESCLVVSTRSLDKGLDVDVFIRAIPMVIRSYPDTHFVITSDGSLRESFERLAKDLKIANRVDFVGEISHQEMPALLGKADIFVSTSPSDGNNVSLNEAMACGAFPIATDIPANRAWIRHGENGLLFPCKDADNLADAIVEALQKLEWRQSVMAENWTIVRAKASWSNSMAEMEHHYQRLFEETNRG
jgi:glycosyltransferase involved in cell wall biosynthesis